MVCRARVLAVAVALTVAVAGTLALPGARRAAGATGATTTADTAAGTTADTAAGPLHWVSCRERLQCATVEVPERYDTPDGPHLSIAVARVPAADPTRRIGSLFVNPGGPGEPAIDALEGIAASLPTSVTDRFDIVAVDPRGVGSSAPVHCGVSLDPLFDQSFAPTTPGGRDALVAALRVVADACAAREGERLRAVSTADTARDLDLVRERLGDPKLTYVGFSYGTYLGSLYAAQFPDRVRAMVLDGAVDPTIDARASTLLQARGFETSLDRFLAWCADAQDCAFGHGGDPARAYDALRARIVATPIDVDGSLTGDRAGTTRQLNDTRFDAAVLLTLYSGRAAWPGLAEALAEADDGQADQLLVAADRFFGRRPGGGDDGSVEAFWAVGCLDDPTAADTGDLQPRAQEVAPRVGAFIANFSLACTVWPTAADTTSPLLPPVPTSPVPAGPALSLAGAAPGALVVGTTSDPATPLVGAKRLAHLLGDAALVVAPGNRHTAIGSGNACVDHAVARYLLSPRAPQPARRRC